MPNVDFRSLSTRGLLAYHRVLEDICFRVKKDSPEYKLLRELDKAFNDQIFANLIKGKDIPREDDPDAGDPLDFLCNKFEVAVDAPKPAPVKVAPKKPKEPEVRMIKPVLKLNIKRKV